MVNFLPLSYCSSILGGNVLEALLKNQDFFLEILHVISTRILARIVWQFYRILLTYIASTPRFTLGHRAKAFVTAFGNLCKANCPS